MCITTVVRFDRSKRAREWERVERLQGKNMNEVVR